VGHGAERNKLTVTAAALENDRITWHRWQRTKRSKPTVVTRGDDAEPRALGLTPARKLVIAPTKFTKSRSSRMTLAACRLITTLSPRSAGLSVSA
jgi:hypothetical protein